MINKICFDFETGEEVKNVMISLDNSILKWTSREFDEDFRKSTPSDDIFQNYPLLLELQKKLGFDVYGEYVVLNQFEGRLKEDVHYGQAINVSLITGEVFWYYLPRRTQPQSDEADTHIMNNYNNRRYNCELNLYISKLCGNCIIELSKHYRGEENKFEEVRKVLGV